MSRLLWPFENSCACRAAQRDRIWSGIPAYFWRNAGSGPRVKNSRKIMTSQELLLALADKDTLELARRMIGKPRLAFLLAKQAIGPEGETSLDAEAVAQILGVHKRHAYRLIKSATCQMKKRVTVESQKNHKASPGESRHVTTGRAPKKRV
jgi:hypothetical protein